METLQRYRGKGEQKMTVEHVHVYSVRSTRGAGHEKKRRNNPTHQPSRMSRAPRCHARTRSGKPCRSPAVKGKRRCRMHGGAAGTGAPAGNRNALRHGRYTALAIAMRREMRALLRRSRELMESI